MYTDTLQITEAQRSRFVQLYMAALDASGLPDDAEFREAIDLVEFGSKVAMQNSHAETEDQLHPLREVPRWTWQAISKPDRRDGSDREEEVKR
jgi:hemoglobin